MVYPFIFIQDNESHAYLSLNCRELQDGIPVFDANNNQLGQSVKAAQAGIAAVVFSRIVMASPGMGK